jgi:hypothetical protein
MKGRVAILVAGLSAAAALAGCGSGPAKVVLKGGSGVVSKAVFNPGSLDDAARVIGVPDEALVFKNDLNAIARSDDPVGEALAIASCQGLSQVADQDRENEGDVIPPTGQDWQRYLNAQVGLLAPAYAGTVSGRVDQFNDTLQLATINPRAAHAYVEVCVRGKR